ncbi:Hypothetical protein J6892_05311 [Nakaseomyces glabratus]
MKTNLNFAAVTACMILLEFGVAFTFGGVLFFIFGIFTFFDRALLALGNILFLIGVVLIIGSQKTLIFSLDQQRDGVPSYFY